jgi:DNA-binding transcriptional regulator YiaG
VSQRERGERRPTSTALELLHVVESKGLDALR